MHFQSQAATVVVDMPPALLSDPVACEGGDVEGAVAAGGLPHAQPATQQWVRPRMKYKYLTSALRPRWLEGVSAVPSLTQQLFTVYDPECSMWELRNRLEHMVMARGDFCVYLHDWLRGRLAMPEPDYGGIMHELVHMLTCFGRM